MQGGIFLERQTQVHNVKVKSRAARLQAETAARVEEWPRRPTWAERLLQMDRLVRNLVVVGCLFAVVAAVKNAGMPQAQSVFGAIQESAGMHWDESVGKLTFVNALLPQSIQAVWNEKEAVSVLAPVDGNIVHAWSASEPYMMIASGENHVHACASGEVMSIAHGLNEERMIRVRHTDGTEALYGNLESCFVQEGDSVQAGQEIGKLLLDSPLAFEWREEGRSVDPQKRLQFQKP